MEEVEKESAKRRRTGVRESRKERKEPPNVDRRPVQVTKAYRLREAQSKVTQ